MEQFDRNFRRKKYRTEKRVGQAIKEANINLNDNDKLNCKIEDKIKIIKNSNK